MEVYSNSFPWKKTQGARLVAELVMGDMICRKEVIMNFNPVWM